MDKQKFDSILPMITAEVIDKIITQYNLSEDKAISDFSKSQVYMLLEKENTKLWQYSADMLLELYMRELKGNLILPEV